MPTMLNRWPVSSEGPLLLIDRHPSQMTLCLNRPQAINALTTEMIQDLQQALDEAENEESITFVLLMGAGDKGFCAGGDLWSLAGAIRDGDVVKADRFFLQEYGLDLRLHRFPKPVMVLADGVTMGGGLGLAAGADLVLVTEKSRLAMPETQIGFFPDVGASRWLFDRCPPGYPEFLGLTGFEMTGTEGVRIGLATDLIQTSRLTEFRQGLENLSPGLFKKKDEALGQLREFTAPFGEKTVPGQPERDCWVAGHFSGQASVRAIMDSLSQDRLHPQWSAEALGLLKKRSPTALSLTLALLRFNQFRELEEAFSVEARAAHFIIQQPDYLEGIRARLIDKDNRPHWNPSSIDQVPLIDIRRL